MILEMITMPLLLFRHKKTQKKKKKKKTQEGGSRKKDGREGGGEKLNLLPLSEEWLYFEKLKEKGFERERELLRVGSNSPIQLCVDLIT